MSCSAALFECKQLLGPETLVVGLARRLDEVLEMGAGEEISEVDKFAVILVFDVDHTPSVLATAHGPSVDCDVPLASDNRKRNEGLYFWLVLSFRMPTDCLQFTLIC